MYSHFATAAKQNEKIHTLDNRQKFICLWVKKRDLLDSNNKNTLLKPPRNQIKWKQFTNRFTFIECTFIYKTTLRIIIL